MQVLELSDLRQLNAAIGWLGLNSPAEARAELAAIPEEHQSHPDVLEARWLICAHEKKWRDGLAVADCEIAVAPQLASGWLHRAYALRRVKGGSLQKAWAALVPAAGHFPQEAIIAYNLSCYACQMNKLDVAREWLKRAIKIEGLRAIKKLALADDDLKPLWPEITDLQEPT